MCERNIDLLPLMFPQLGTWPTTQVCALTTNPNKNLLIHRQGLFFYRGLIVKPYGGQSGRPPERTMHS